MILLRAVRWISWCRHKHHISSIRDVWSCNSQVDKTSNESPLNCGISPKFSIFPTMGSTAVELSRWAKVIKPFAYFCWLIKIPYAAVCISKPRNLTHILHMKWSMKCLLNIPCPTQIRSSNDDIIYINNDCDPSWWSPEKHWGIILTLDKKQIAGESAGIL